MRLLLKSVFALIMLIIVTLIAVPFFIDVNDYKPEITKAVKDATGRTLTIDGDINLSLFPWIVVDLGALSLSNAEGFTADNFAKVNAAKVSVKLIPLLSKTVELDTVILDGLVLNLEKNKAGKTNWDDLSGSSKDTPSSEESTTTASKSASPALNGFSLGGIDISDANIFWLDATAENYHIENINLKTGAVEIGKPTTVAFSTTINAPSLPNGKADISLDTIIAVDMAAQTLSLNDLVLAVQDFVLTGEVNVSQLNSGSPAIKGKLAIAPFDFRQLATDLDIKLPPMADPTTLTLIKLATDFTASSKSFTTSNLAITLDQTTLSGDFGVTLATQALLFALKLDEIDIDRYLPPANDQAAASQKTASKKPVAKTDDSLPLEALRQINAKGTFDIGKLKVAKINSSNIHLEIDGHDGLVKLSPLNAELYQGHYKGDINLDARGKTLKVSINELLDKVQVEPLLTDMQGEAPISGTTMFQAKLTGDGATVAQIKQSLNGSGKFSFLNGAVKGVNIAESIRQAKAAMSGKKLPASNEPVETDFASLTGSFKMTKGIVNNQDLAMMSPLLRINGAGKIDLPKEGIDYKLKVSIVETSSGQAGKDLADLNGLTIPVQITGTFDTPKPSVDMAELATEEVKSKASKELGKLLGDTEGDSSTEDLLKKFF